MIKEKRKTNNKNRILAMLVMLLIIIGIFVFSKSSMYINNTKSVKNKAGEKSNSIIKSADITILDGIGPFDNNNEPGNDENNHNGIIRANDTLTYYIQPFTKTIDENNKNYGNLIIEGKIEKKKNLIWDKKEIGKWAQNKIKYTEDDNYYYFKYTQNYKELIGSEIGGASITLPFQLKVAGTKNGTKIVPEFTIYMEGNTEEQKYKSKPKEVTVSSKPSYDIQLRETTDSQQKKISYNGKEGRVTHYTIAVGLKKDNNKGLKGVEYPTGDILSNISFKSTFSPTEDPFKGKTEDITKEFEPEIIQYKLNARQADKLEKIPENTKYHDELYDKYYPQANKINGISSWYFQNEDKEPTAGDIQIKKQGYNNYLLRFYDYLMDEKTILPNVSDSISSDRYRLVTVGLVAVFNPLPDTTWREEYIKRQDILGYTEKDLNYRLENEIYLKNPRYIKEGGQEENISNDLRQLYTLFNYIKGTYGSYIKPDIFEKFAIRGEGFTYYNDFKIHSKYYLDKVPDEEYKIRGFIQLTKFDSKFFYPKGIDTRNSSKFDKVYWATKEDGTDWINDEEMNKASYKDLVYYDNLEEAKKHGKVAGYITQVKNNEGVFDKGLEYKIYANMGITSEAKEGDVGQMLTDSYWYFDENDGGDIKEGKFEPPASGKGYIIENRDYVKTKYDERGYKLSGTHAPDGYHSGNSLLIVDGLPSISVNTDKETYNVSLDETIIKLKANPSISSSLRDNAKDKEKKIRVEVYLPKGIDYVPGTSKIKGENIEPKEIKKNK